MSVYFIACGGFIKVGYSKNAERRFHNLFQSSSRYSAPRAAYEARDTRELLRFIEGDKSTEFAIHNALGDFYAGCEWFVDEPALREWIAKVRPDDRPAARRYAKLKRGGGKVEVPRGEQGGCNVALVMATYGKRRSAVA
jgi:hypothetical protein